MHPGCDEVSQMLDGSIEVEVLPEDGRAALKKVVCEGAYIVLPQGRWHCQTMPARMIEHYLKPGKTLHVVESNRR